MSEAVKKVQELLKLPQHLCDMCGKCCKIATFKGGLSYDEIIKLINDPDEDPTQIEGAKDFLTIFVPYKSREDAMKAGPGLIERVLERFGKDSEVSFFYCKYVGENNSCLIHEDRPMLCRMYPVPHSRTFYNPGCGFEEQGKKNWQEIEEIIEQLKRNNQ